MKQINTNYNNLTEAEKDSDREQADKIIQLLKKVTGKDMDVGGKI